MQAKKITRLLFSGVAVLVFFALSACPAIAQIKVDYGPKVGPNASIFTGKMPFKDMAKPKLGMGLGAFINIRSIKSKSFQFEGNIMFSLRGNRSNYTNFDFLERNPNLSASEVKSYNIGYLEFPLLCKYMFNFNDNFRAFVMAGPTYSGIVYAKYVGNGVEYDNDKIRTFLQRDDFGITFGSGISWFYLDRWYFLDLRYFQGIRNVSQRLTKNLDPYNELISKDDLRKDLPVFKDDALIYNSTLMLSFGVSLSRQINLRYQ